MKIQNISFEIFAGLVSGRISYVAHKTATLKYNRLTRSFLMEGKTGKHLLSYDTTDDVRLNAHWLSFASYN